MARLPQAGARWRQPAFPFGFGLSYTTYAYDNLRLAAERLGAADTLVALVDVTNTGGVAGEEIVQLYVAAEGSAVEPRSGGTEGLCRGWPWRRGRRAPCGWTYRLPTWRTTMGPAAGSWRPSSIR